MWRKGGGDLREPDDTDGDGESFLPPPLAIDGEAASLSEEDLLNPELAEDDDVTVVAVLKDAIEDDGIIGEDNDFSADTPLGDLIARSCSSWIL
jgi:hypothetical protein